MLRITQVREDGDTIHLKVEGRVIGDGVSELDRTCEDSLSRNQRIILDMSDVTYIDRQGVDALKRILGNNVQLTDATLLLQALLG
jgi:anti-anti-sigma regulatory factor